MTATNTRLMMGRQHRPETPKASREAKKREGKKMTSAAMEYAKRGAPTEIMHDQYKGRLVDVQPLNDGYVCGIYRFPGGECCGGPMIRLIGK